MMSSTGQSDDRSSRDKVQHSSPYDSSQHPESRVEQALYVISIAAELAGMHAQTLRTYDRLGLVTPMRTRGGGRRYSTRDVELLREIQRLSQEEGVNLAGIKAIIALRRENERLTAANAALRAENAALHDENTQLHRYSRRAGGELVHIPRSTAIVAWTPRQAGRRRNG